MELVGQEQKIQCFLPLQCDRYGNIKKIGEEYLLKTNYTGFKGSLKLFFIPLCDAGWTIVYHNENYADTSGKYFVKAVTYSFGTDQGLRQDVELGQRL